MIEEAEPLNRNEPDLGYQVRATPPRDMYDLSDEHSTNLLPSFPSAVGGITQNPGQMGFM